MPTPSYFRSPPCGAGCAVLRRNRRIPTCGLFPSPSVGSIQFLPGFLVSRLHACDTSRGRSPWDFRSLRWHASLPVVHSGYPRRATFEEGQERICPGGSSLRLAQVRLSSLPVSSSNGENLTPACSLVFQTTLQRIIICLPSHSVCSSHV